MNKAKSKDRHENSESIKAAAVIGLSIAACTAGLMAVTWFCVTGLQENSEKMRKYKVKEAVVSTPNEYGKLMFNNRETIDDKMPHEHSHNRYLHGRDLELRKLYQAALDEYTLSLGELKADIAQGHTDPDDPRMLAMRYQGMADCHGALGQGDKCIEDLTNAIRVHPKTMYYKARAQVYKVLGRKDLAKADIAAMKRLKAESPVDLRKDMVNGFLYDSELKKNNKDKEK